MRGKTFFLSLAATTLWASPSSAAVLLFELDGEFRGDATIAPVGGTPTSLTSQSFTFRAVFDDEGIVYRAGPPGMPLPGFAAYAFQSATLTIGGVSYDVASFMSNPDNGAVLALFDPSNPFNPGFYAGGFINNPLVPSQGLVSRFQSAPAGFSAIDPTVGEYSGFVGYGAVSGPTFSGGPGSACFADPALCAIRPISLSRGGDQYNLTLASGAFNAQGQFAFSARLSNAVPEPSTWAMMLLGFFGAGAALRRAKGAVRLSASPV